MLDYLLDEIGRVFWNVNQREWKLGYDPKIPGVEVRPYYWGDETDKEATKPNFKFGEAEIRWYKYPGRGMTVNVDWGPEKWV